MTKAIKELNTSGFVPIAKDVFTYLGICRVRGTCTKSGISELHYAKLHQGTFCGNVQGAFANALGK